MGKRKTPTTGEDAVRLAMPTNTWVLGEVLPPGLLESVKPSDADAPVFDILKVLGGYDDDDKTPG